MTIPMTRNELRGSPQHRARVLVDITFKSWTVSNNINMHHNIVHSIKPAHTDTTI